MVNTSEKVYNVTSTSSYEGLAQQVNGFIGGTMGIAFVLTIWIIAFFSLAQYPNVDSLKASTYVAWLLSVFMTILGLLQPAFTLLLFIVVLAVTGYSAKPRT